MKKILLTTALIATPIFANTMGVKSIDGNYTNEINKDGSVTTRETKDFKATVHFGDAKKYGQLSITAVRRNEIRRKNLDLGKIHGEEKTNMFALTYTKAHPSWGFWGTTVGYGQGTNDLNINWGLTSGQNSAYTMATTNDAAGITADIDKDGTSDSFTKRYLTALDTDVTNGNTNAVTTLLSSIKTALTSGDADATIALAKAGAELAVVLKGKAGAKSDASDSRANKVQKGSTTSTMMFTSAFIGTKISASGFDIMPMAKITYKKKELKALDLTLASSPATPFALKSGKEFNTDLTLTITRDVLGGTINVNSGLTYDMGTDIAYNITHGGGIKTVLDNPYNKAGYSAGIGYAYTIMDSITAKATFDFYKNGANELKTTYVSIGYTF